MDITPVISSYLSTNLGPDPENPGKRKKPEYGIRASLDEELLELTITFLDGRSYCCMEWACHISLTDKNRWDCLRRHCAEHQIQTPEQFKLNLCCVVEQGAQFFDLSRPDRGLRGWYDMHTSDSYRYEVSSTEPSHNA